MTQLNPSHSLYSVTETFMNFPEVLLMLLRSFMKPLLYQDVLCMLARDSCQMLPDCVATFVTTIPYTPKRDNIPWPISDQISFKIPRHPRGKWEAWESPGIQVHRMHSKNQWTQYILALSHSDILASSLPQYLQFYTIFNYVPNVTDMTSYRIYGELYCALKGGFLGEPKKKTLRLLSC